MSYRHADTGKALKLLELLGSHMLQKEFGHFVTMHTHKVHYPGLQEESKVIQRRLDELVSRMAVVYLFAIFDDYATSAMNQAIPDDKKLVFSAYRHVRNSAAHGMLFKRSPVKNTAYDAFEQVMLGANPLPGIIHDPTDMVFAGTGIELHCRAYMEEILGLIIGGLENGPS